MPAGCGRRDFGKRLLARLHRFAVLRGLARATLATLVAGTGAAAMSGAARAAPYILVDAASGAVLDQHDATQPWFPASTTKLMSVYVALDAVASGRLSLNTPLMVSPRALSMAPSKMGFKAGTQVTLDNALKMLMVKSANDIAVTVAEGVSGSVEAFADEMNATAARLGLRESHWTNPNGLPDVRHVSSARDLAILARALLQRFPDQADLYDIGAMRLGTRIFPTHNGLLGRYAGADGMKTGFTCAAGFNVVATASRGGRKLIAVVLGAPSVGARTVRAASLLDRGFAGVANAGGSVTSLASVGGTAPDMHDGVCQNRGKATAQYLAEIDDTAIPLTTDYTLAAGSQPERSFLSFGASVPPPAIAPSAIATLPRPVFTPIDVFVGPMPGWTGPIAHADNYAGPAAGRATAYATQKAGETPLPASEDALPMKRGPAKAARKPAAKIAHAATPRIPANAGGKGADKKKTAAARPTSSVKPIALVKPAHDKPAPKGKANAVQGANDKAGTKDNTARDE